MAISEPVFIRPFVLIRPNDTGTFRRHFISTCKRVGFFAYFPIVIRPDAILIQFAFFDARNKAFPNARTIPTDIQIVFVTIPMIEITNDLDLTRSRCIHRKINTPLPTNLHDVATEFFIQTIMLTRSKKVYVKIRKTAMCDDTVRHIGNFNILPKVKKNVD